MEPDHRRMKKQTEDAIHVTVPHEDAEEGDFELSFRITQLSRLSRPFRSRDHFGVRHQTIFTTPKLTLPVTHPASSTPLDSSRVSKTHSVGASKRDFLEV